MSTPDGTIHHLEKEGEAARGWKARMAAWAAVALLAVAQAAAMAQAAAAEKLKPFVLSYRGPGTIEAKVDEAKTRLREAGFRIVADYVPYENAHVVVFTSERLLRAVAKQKWGGFAAPQRVGVVKVGDEVQVHYVNPVYMAHAYRFKGDDLSWLREQIEGALGAVQDFGARGLTPKKLRKYHYTFGMEYFDDPYDLGRYGSYRAAIQRVEKGLAEGKAGVTKVYRIDIPGKQETVFGVARRAPTPKDKHMDDKFIMHDTVEVKPELKTVAYLPYEILVTGDRVIALHMRFRMAVFHPDFRMMGKYSFMTLMPSPAAIERAFRKTMGLDEEEDF